MEVLVVILSWLLFGGAASYFASGRGRDPFAWFLIGMLLGILGLIILFLLPPIKTEEEKEESLEEELLPVQQEPSSRLKEWFYLDEKREQKGPLSFSSFKKLWKQGLLVPETLVWTDGMNEWRPLGELQELKQELQ